MDSILPWPECLGCFDEETCRYFLRELGQRMVQFYPFSVGIDEVHSQIVDEYGLQGAPDAMSLLQELLEDDNTAAGVGDDGDIWTSWRHSWRHRNDNPMNPYVPRVRGRILPPPTSVRIRLLKSSNFITRQLSINQHSAEPLSNPMGPASPARASHQLLSSNYSRQNSPPRSSRSSRNDVQEAAGEKPLLSGYKSASLASASDTHSPKRSASDPTRKHASPFRLTSPRRRRDAIPPRPDQSGTFGVNVILEEEWSGSPPRHTSMLVDKTEHVGPTDRKTPLSARVNGDKINRYSLPSDLTSTDREATPTGRRATHRQARMIDGALFHPKSRKGKFIESDSIGAESPVKQERERDTERTSAPPSKQHSRASWLHSVLARLRGDHSRRSAEPKLRKRHSSLTSCGFMASPPSNKSSVLQSDLSQVAEMRQTTSISRFGLDGAAEDRCNKPLPLSPGDLRRTSIQSDVQRAFFDRATGPTFSSPCASTLSTSQIPPLCYESEMAPLTSATMSGPHELSPTERNWKYRLSTSSSRSGPPTPSSFATFANKNPYLDSSEPSTPTMPQPPPLSIHKQKISSTEWPFRATQDLRCCKVEEASSENRAAPETQRDVAKKSTETARSTLHPEKERGRKPATRTIPVNLTQTKLDCSQPKTPSPRSRSPVKRFVGMVKSMSANQMSEHTPPSAKDTPASARKGRWKELSNKLRHGFLTADLEQLEQEEMMEQYSTHGDVHILTPPPSRQRTKFPVSIKSSGQSKLWSELEYMLIETCNTFLKDELEHGRLSRDSIIRAKRQWQARNRPQTIEFYYDQATQYEIIVANLQTVKLYSDYAEDAIMLNSVLQQWKILIRELSVKTLCMPDSIVRRWLHDGRRVLELLGASQITLAHLDRLSGLCFAVFGSAEKQRAKQRSRADTTTSRRRSASDGSQNTLLLHEQALMNNGMIGGVVAPPLPSHRPTGNAMRKVTPQERRLAQQAQKSPERDQFLFTGGDSPLKSLVTNGEKSRFAFD